MSHLRFAFLAHVSGGCVFFRHLPDICVVKLCVLSFICVDMFRPKLDQIHRMGVISGRLVCFHYVGSLVIVSFLYSEMFGVELIWLSFMLFALFDVSDRKSN